MAHVNFENRGGLVAGAGGGMGLAIANGLIEGGADIVLADIKPAPEGIAAGPGRALYLEERWMKSIKLGIARGFSNSAIR